MKRRSLERSLTAMLAAANKQAGFVQSILCTEQGLLLASAGEDGHAEEAAGMVSLFDDIASRAARDLPVGGVDELTLVGENGRRYIVRPVARGVQTRLFLCVVAPRSARWRRATTLLLGRLSEAVAPLLASEEAADA